MCLGKKLTVGKIHHVKTLGAVGIPEALQPELCSTIGMSPVCCGEKDTNAVVVAGTYLWNMTHWATVTMLSWVSLRAESFAKTASSLYAIL